MNEAINALTVHPAVEFFLRLMVFLLGATVGSFLNVVIYRVPLGISVHDPKRSFCPSCKYQIPWYCNIPVFSWVALRGKCANCGTKISPRYVVVEFLTGCLFLLVWLWPWTAGYLVVLPYWVLLCLFVATVYIDFDHYIIPDEITLGGLVAGVVLSAVFPAMHAVISWWQGLLWSLAGAALGYALLWLVVELGKRAFGKFALEFEGGEKFVICQDDQEEEPALSVGGEKYLWSDLLFRKSDRLVLKVQEATLGDDSYGVAEIVAGEEEFVVRPPQRKGNAKPGGDAGGDASEFEPKSYPLESLQRIDGVAESAVVPREAMGFGDVKFMAMLGAFLGWKAVLFTLFAASVVGTAIALPMRLAGRAEWAAKIPFGPYLVLGGLIYLFFGESILSWYTMLGK